jgi:transposase-like protein
MGLPAGARARTMAATEVVPQAVRRRYSAEYKLKILAEVDNCKNSGDIGALLRREGLYSSHLTKWRRQRAEGQLAALAPQKRGRKNLPVNPLAAEVARLQRENERLTKKLHQAETIIEVQKKISQILGIAQPEIAEQS